MRHTSLSIVILASRAFAQDSTNNTDTTICRNHQLLDQTSTGTVNATGSVSFSWDNAAARDIGATEPWYISILVNDTVQGHEVDTSANNGGAVALPYLSVPDHPRNVSVCLYQFASQNATSTGDGGDGNIGCAGVFSETCTSYLRELLLNQTSGGVSGEPKCGNPAPVVAGNERREQACGDLGNRITFRGYQDVANATCTYPTLPGVDIPDGYANHDIGVSLSPFSAKDYESAWANYSHIAYDLILVQPVPFAIVATFPSSTDSRVEGSNLSFDKEVQFVCVTPNDTQSGSRGVPENKTPWRSTSDGTRRQSDVLVSLVLASIVALILV